MRVSKSYRRWLWMGLAVLVGGAFLGAILRADPSTTPPSGDSKTQSSEVFTPAHSSVLDALRDFLDHHPEHPAQPIAFTHKVHLANNLKCVDCHVGVDTGPDAVIPSVKFCMMCHQVIAVERPEIKKLAAYQSRGEDIPWARVYNYSASAHVKFNHAPHIRADVACSSCHGDMTQQTTAERKINLNMGYCLTCHQERKVSIDCQTCHY
jgi:hypothetical protein